MVLPQVLREHHCQFTLMIKALIFDFDGLILDTETPELLAWQEIYRDYGQDLTVQTWGQIVGGSAASDFDPAEHLEHADRREAGSSPVE